MYWHKWYRKYICMYLVCNVTKNNFLSFTNIKYLHKKWVPLYGGGQIAPPHIIECGYTWDFVMT